MTPEHAALVEKVAAVIFGGPVDYARAPENWRKAAARAIDLIRNETLEEAARVADENNDWYTADAIRALKEKKE